MMMESANVTGNIRIWVLSCVMHQLGGSPVTHVEITIRIEYGCCLFSASPPIRLGYDYEIEG